MSQQRERGLEFKVGLLILLSSAILVAFVFILGNFSLRSGYKIYVDFDYIGALQPGAPVKVSGIKVGKVEGVEFLGGKPDPKVEGKRVQVRVTVWIEDRVRDSIRKDAAFYINTAGVLGEQYLEIVPGQNWNDPPITANAYIHDERVHNPPRTDLVVARLYEVLDGLAAVLRDDRDAIKNLLTNSANAVAEANRLLVENRAQIGELIANGSSLAKEAKVTLSKVNAGLADGRPVANLVANADATLKAAQNTMTTLTPTAQALMTDATRVTKTITEERIDKAIGAADKAATAAGKAGGLIDNVNGMITDLRAGKGTAGALLARDDIYSDLRELIRDLKRNPWKFFWKE